MSRAYDAKQAALAAYPDNIEAAVYLFIGYLNFDIADFEYEFGMTVEKYIFGDEQPQDKG